MEIAMNKISWESWNVVEDELCQKHKNKNKIELVSDEDDDSLSLDKQELIAFPQMNPSFVTTPFGNYDPESYFRPAQRWDCWIAHTNFRLTTDIVSLLVNVEGISAIKIMDRYSFCIGVGKMFNFKHVAAEIGRLLCSAKEEELIENLPDDILEEVEKIKQNINVNKYWSIFVDSNNNIYSYHTDSLEDFELNTFSFEKIKKDHGGYLLKGKNEE
jgi:hypothetical protein